MHVLFSGPCAVHGMVLISEHLLLEFAALLGFQRQRRSGAGQQTRHADRLAGLIAVTIVTGVDPGNGLFDLLDRKSTRLNSSH